VTDALLVKLMVGRKVSQRFPAPPPPRAQTLLEVRALERTGSFGPVSFSLKSGEILGFAGLIGSGRTELARSLIGADRATGGSVTIDGISTRFRSPREAKRHGLCLLPEDRKAQGLVLSLSVLHNVSLASLEKISRFGFIRGGTERKKVSTLVDRLSVRTPGLGVVARNLSGGNQQKLVLAKWLAVEPRVIIFDEPTRGIDVGAKFEVYRLINNLAKQGVGVIMISSDLSEVLGLSSRVAVMHEGRLASILPRRAAGPVRVMRLAMGLSRA
jgi:ribose transport system ATP-binding protein